MGATKATNYLTSRALGADGHVWAEGAPILNFMLASLQRWVIGGQIVGNKKTPNFLHRIKAGGGEWGGGNLIATGSA